MAEVIGNIDTIVKDNNIILKSKNSIFYSAFYFDNVYDETSIKNFIKSTERLIRHSEEYNTYLGLMKTNYSVLNYDNILSNISNMDADIEFHHYPFTLYEIVEIVMNYHFINNDKFTSFSIAKEVMNLHFEQKIGFVPLTTTNHQLAHNGSLFISLKQVFGQWESFIEKYKTGISDVQLKYIEKLKSLTNAKFASDFKGIY